MLHLPKVAGSEAAQQWITGLGIAVAICGWGCSSQQQRGSKHQSAAPFVAAAEAKDTQSQLRHFKEQWELSSPVSRRHLRLDLEEFVRRHRGDPSIREAELMLAEIALDERRYSNAELLLQPLLAKRSGRLRDEAQLLLAAVEIRRGKVDAGLLLLEPLEGKLISASAEERFYRERIAGAIVARRWRLAVDAMEAWLQKQGARNGRAIKNWISQSLVEVPAQALFNIIRPETDASILEPTDETKRWLLHALIDRIAHEVLANGDPQLARALLESAPPWIKAGERGEKLLALASLAETAAQISGRALGFVLGGETDLERSRNLRVAAGVIRALEQARARGVKVEYVTSEDQGSTALALDDLSGQGASFVIGGVDEVSARAALLFAHTQRVPTLVLVQPQVVPPPSDFGFVTGVAEAEEIAAVARAEPSAAAPLALGGEGCPQLTSESLNEAWARNAPPVVFLGEASCLRTLASSGRPADFSAWVLGLSAASGPVPEGLKLRYLSAGSYPVTESRAGTSNAAAARQWDWFFALGYDSAQLAIAAMLESPTVAATDRNQVRAIHERSARALEGVRLSLVTSETRGFDERHRIARELIVR